MLKTLKDNWHHLRHGKPGSRFKDFYDYRAAHRAGPFSPARIITIIIAVALILGGIAVGWLPGPGGFVAIFGLALLAQEFRPLAAAMDWCERVIRILWRKFRSLPIPAQAGAYALCLAAGAGLAYLAYDLIWSG